MSETRRCPRGIEEFWSQEYGKLAERRKEAEALVKGMEQWLMT